MQVRLIPTADERVGVQVKLRNPLRTRAIPERFCGGDSLRRGALSSVQYAPLPLERLTDCRRAAVLTADLALFTSELRSAPAERQRPFRSFPFRVHRVK